MALVPEVTLQDMRFMTLKNHRTQKESHKDFLERRRAGSEAFILGCWGTLTLQRSPPGLVFD